MKRIIIPLILVIGVLFALDFYAFKGVAQPFIESHRREAMGDWFSGNWGDWLGLVMFHIVMVAYIIGIKIEPDFYEEVGSSAKGIAFFVALPLVSLALIYLI